jgi:predicted metal-dependent phosphotriesterase family hydrolase
MATEEAMCSTAASGKTICDPTNIGTARGGSEADIHQMTVANPARAFAFTDPGEKTS